MRDLNRNSAGFELWSGWGDKLEENERERVSKIIEFIPEDIESILDVGCGDGRIINELKGFLRVVGLDFCESALKYVKTDKVLSSCDKIPFTRGEFDLVLLNEVLEHLPEKVYIETIREVCRLNPKFVIISVPYNQNLKGFLVKCSDCGCVYLPDASTCTHVRSFNHDDIPDLFASYYIIDRIDYCGYTYSDPMLRLKHKCDYYLFTNLARCPVCESPNQLCKGGVMLKIINIFNSVICRKQASWILVRYMLKN